METTNHDNVNVKVNSRITIYGNVVFVGSISVAGVGFLFLAIWMLNNWAQAITLSGVIVYGLVASFFLVIIGAVAAIWIKFVVHPTIDARERAATIRGQELKNRVVWAQPNGIVYESVPGTLSVVPLFPKMIEAPAKVEQPYDENSVLEVYGLGRSVKDTAADCHITEYKARSIINKAGVMRAKD
jgi:hypothetical protein